MPADPIPAFSMTAEERTIARQWRAPTWRDRPETDPTVKVRCVCGREVFPRQFFDVRAVVAIPLAWCCDGCLTLYLEHRRTVDRLELLRAWRAPDPVLRRAAAREARLRAQRAGAQDAPDSAPAGSGIDSDQD